MTAAYVQPLREHRRYMQTLLDARSVILGGPFVDDAGGIVALEAASLEAAREVAARDPAIRDGIMQCDVHPWLPRVFVFTPRLRRRS